MKSLIFIVSLMAVGFTTSSAEAQNGIDFSPLTREVPFSTYLQQDQQAQQRALAIRAQREANERAEADAQQAAAERAAVQQSSAERVDRAKRVGRLMATGDCDGAKSLALTEGDFDMAGRVPALCVRKAQ